MAQMLGCARSARRQPGEAVPAPQRPVAADEPLARCEVALQPAAGGNVLNPAGHGEAAAQRRRCADHLSQRARPLGQCGRRIDCPEIRPELFRAVIFAVEGCRKRILEGSADRRLKTRSDMERAQHPRFAADISGGRQHRLERRLLRLQPGQPGPGAAGDIERRRFLGLARRQLALCCFERYPAALGQRFGRGQCRGSRRHRLARHRAGRRGRALPLGFEAAGFEPIAALGELPMLALERTALRRPGGRGLGRALQPGFGRREPRGDRGEPGRGRGQGRAVLGRRGAEAVALLPQPDECRLGIGEARRLAIRVGGQLGQPPLGLFAGGDDLHQFAFEDVAAMGQLLGFRHGLGRGAAQRRQLRFGDLAGPARGRSASLRLGERALGRGKLGSEVFQFALGSTPAREEQQRLVAADLLAEPAIALGLARLFLQRCEVRRQKSRSHRRAGPDWPRPRRA